MPNLFPDAFATVVSSEAATAATTANNKTFGNSFQFDFETGEFVISPSGKLIQTTGAAAWVEWCQKALFTQRYRFLAYDDAYGQEFETLVGQVLTRLATESEIKRMATECLKVHPMTDKVSDFSFDWDTAGRGAVIFICKVTNILGDTTNILGSAVRG